jgi:hypothetical protein
MAREVGGAGPAGGDDDLLCSIGRRKMEADGPNGQMGQLVVGPIGTKFEGKFFSE